MISRRMLLQAAMLAAVPLAAPRKKRRLVPSDTLYPSDVLYPRG